MQKEIFIFVGPPGAGKGSLSRLCVKRFGWVQLSTGNLCRHHIAQGTEIGKSIDFIIKSGKLISDSLIVAMIEKWLLEQGNNYAGIILDGFPRTLKQAEEFDKLLQKEHLKNCTVRVIGMDLSPQVAIERLLNRMICQNSECQAVYSSSDVLECTDCLTPLIQRTDDSNVSIIQERLLIYEKYKNALFDYYRASRRLTHVLNVEKPLEEVFGQFIDFIQAPQGSND
jgi:adenylate kinase